MSLWTLAALFCIGATGSSFVCAILLFTQGYPFKFFLLYLFLLALSLSGLLFALGVLPV